MTPAHIAIGLLCAAAFAVARHGARLALALWVSAALLCGCALVPAPTLETTGSLPLDKAPPWSALRMYEAGRRDALDDLRKAAVWSRPIYSCDDVVSYVDSDLPVPSWKSRETDMKLLDTCRKNGNYNAGLAAEMRAVLKAAQ